MFVIKKIIGLLTNPGTLVLVILGYGVWRLAFSRGDKKKGWVMLGLGVVCFYLFATAPLPNYLIRTLESRYEPRNAAKNLSAIKYIVVLSEDLRKNDQVPPTSQLSGTTALRLAEGIRLFHTLGGAPVLILAGDGPWEQVAERMKAYAQALGVPPAKLRSETQSKDTYGNAVGVRSIVKDQPFLLVTSASHMPRAMGIFQRLGMKPIAAPADYRYTQEYLFSDFFPSGRHLTTMEAVVHEYLGLAYVYFFPRRAGE